MLAVGRAIVVAANRSLWRLRAVTLGVRIAAIADDAVMLVRHTYASGWYLPGGSVDRNEDAVQAAARELEEETALRCTRLPEIVGLFRHGAHDHVAFYIARSFELTDAPLPRHEIAEAAFFPLSHLPDGATVATRRHLFGIGTSAALRSGEW